MELHYAISQNRRPHFIFSTKHSHNRLNPICLPAIPNTHYQRLHPLRGRVSVTTDIVRIERLVNDLKPYMTPESQTLVGVKVVSKNEKKKSKDRIKWGRYVYATNDGKIIELFFMCSECYVQPWGLIHFHDKYI